MTAEEYQWESRRLRALRIAHRQITGFNSGRPLPSEWRLKVEFLSRRLSMWSRASFLATAQRAGVSRMIRARHSSSRPKRTRRVRLARLPASSRGAGRPGLEQFRCREAVR